MGCNIISLGNGATAIICGAPSDHECNSKGPLVFSFNTGFMGTLFDACIEYGVNPEYCDADKMFFLEKKDILINGSSTTCSICGSAAIDEAYKM